MINIFIDTSAIYTDPFWERTYAKELIASAKSKKTVIYIPEVVYEELKYNYANDLKTHQEKIEKSLSEINKISLKKQKISLPNINKKISEFEDFYKSLFLHKNIIKLITKPPVLNGVLKQSIIHAKPFFNTSNKPQFKDAVIWNTCRHEAFKNNLRIHLITGNSHDFIKEELVKEYENLECYSNILDFVKLHKDIVSKPDTSFQKWISKTIINEKFILNLIQKNSEIVNKLENIAFQELENSKNRYKDSPIRIDENTIRSIAVFDIEQEFDHMNSYISKLHKLEIDTFNNYSTITCEVCVSIDGFIYNKSKSSNPLLKFKRNFYIPLTCSIDKEKIIKDIQIENYAVRVHSSNY